jgi:hypothetical protein
MFSFIRTFPIRNAVKCLRTALLLYRYRGVVDGVVEERYYLEISHILQNMTIRSNVPIADNEITKMFSVLDTYH